MKAKRPLDCFIYLQFCQISDHLQRSGGVWGDVCVDFNGETVPGWDSDCFQGVRSGVFVGLVFNGVVLCCWGSLQNCYFLSVVGPCQKGETDCFWGWNQSNQLCVLEHTFLFVKNITNICRYVFLCVILEAFFVLYSRVRSQLQVVVLHCGGDHQLVTRRWRCSWETVSNCRALTTQSAERRVRPTPVHPHLHVCLQPASVFCITFVCWCQADSHFH